MKWKKIKKDTVVNGAALCITNTNIPIEWNNFNAESMLAKGYTHYIKMEDIINLPKE